MSAHLLSHLNSPYYGIARNVELTPKNNIIRTTGSVILKMSHGYTTEKDGQDPLVTLADDVLSQFSLAAQAGAWMVDMLPFRKSYLFNRHRISTRELTYSSVRLRIQYNMFQTGCLVLPSNVLAQNGKVI